MAKNTPDTLSLVVDGKTVEIKTADSKNLGIDDALRDPGEFRSFAANPAAFAQRFGLTIDSELSDLLAKSIGGAASPDALLPGRGDAKPQATLWAIAVGTYSIAASKIAVAAVE